MSTFPSVLTSYTNPQATDRLNSPSHSGIETAQNGGLSQVEAVIGVEGASSVIGSLQYLIKSPASNGGGHVQTANKGGTGQTSYAKGDLLVAQSSSVLTKLAIGADGLVLTANSSVATGVSWASNAVVNSIEILPAYGGATIQNLDPFDSNTTMYASRWFSPVGINNATKVYFNGTNIGASGTIKLAIFSHDGQQQVVSVTSGTISATGDNSITIPSTNIGAGVYYVAVIPVSTTVITMRGFSKPEAGIQNSVAGKATYVGAKSVVAGTMPATFAPSSLIGGSAHLPILRFEQ